jgi:F-type H+-transporting ATPase subunit delta
VDQLGADLARFADALDLGDGQLRVALENPGVTGTQKRAVMDAVLEKLGLHPMAANFLKLVIEKGRFLEFDGMHAAYGRMADELAGRVQAEVSTARALDTAMQAEVQAALSKTTGKQVAVTWTVDPALIGGLVAHVGDKVYDASVRARLDAMKRALIAGDSTAEATEA